MKIKTIALWVIFLVVIEQIIKLVISTYYQDINLEIIPSLFEFKPTFNDKSFYWVSVLFHADVGRWTRLLTGAIIFVILYIVYRYIKTIYKQSKLVNVAFLFAFAGAMCSMSDNIFFGGSWDYISLKPFPTCDLKDLYLNCFGCLLIIGVLTNQKDLPPVKKNDFWKWLKKKKEK
jgi:signal peptidase II